MRTKKMNQVRLGSFILTGLVLFMAGLYYIGQKQRLFSNVFHVKGIFNNVSGLQVGNNVRFSGITVGTVENIEIISDTSVRVDMVIDRETKKFIRRDAKATIGSEGLMGNRVINIVPGTAGGEEINDNDLILTVQPLNIDLILDRLRSTNENANRVTENIARLTQALINGKGSIGRLLSDSSFATELELTLKTIKQGSLQFSTNMMELHSTTDYANKVSGNLNDITNCIRCGKGTIGKLLMDTLFADNLDLTLATIRNGAKGFEENMENAKHSFLLKGPLKNKPDPKTNDPKR